jgi:hypothetical protein
MTALGTVIHDEHHLRVVPDGTIISWLRIPGDPTSEAVAFVRREVAYPTTEYAAAHPRDTKPEVTVWISPGGWDPHTIEQAGVTFPCQVVRWGDVSTELITPPEAPLLAETLVSGGTWHREKALECAVRLFSAEAAIHWIVPRNGDGPYFTPLLDAAATFEAWLDRLPGHGDGTDLDYADDGTRVEVQGETTECCDNPHCICGGGR